MSTSLLAFFTLLEKRVFPLLASDKTWRFQRIVDFRAREGTLQIWEEPGGVLTGQVSMRETRHEDGLPSFNGAAQTAAGGNDTRKFSFQPQNEAEVERQAQLIAETWSQSLRLDGGGPS